MYAMDIALDLVSVLFSCEMQMYETKRVCLMIIFTRSRFIWDALHDSAYSLAISKFVRLSVSSHRLHIVQELLG